MRLVEDIGFWYDAQSLWARLQRAAHLMSTMRLQLLTGGPKLAEAGRVNLGSLLVTAMAEANLRSLELFAERHIQATDGSVLLAERPTLESELDSAELRMVRLASELATACGASPSRMD